MGERDPGDVLDVVGVGVEHWHVHVLRQVDEDAEFSFASAGPRRVALTVELAGAPDGVPPMMMVLDAADARRISEALQFYSGQAQMRDAGERN